MNDSSLISGVIGILGGFVAVVVILAVLQILGAWKVFEKAGKPGWHCIIPFLNTYDYFMISGFGSTPAIIGAVGTAVACLITFSGFAGGSGALTGIGTFLSVICWAVSGVMQLMSCFMLPGKFNKGTGAGFLSKTRQKTPLRLEQSHGDEWRFSVTASSCLIFKKCPLLKA